MVAYSQPLDVT